MAGRVIHLSKQIHVLPLAMNDAASCGFAAQYVLQYRPSSVLLSHVGSDDPLWGTAARPQGAGDSSFTDNVIKPSRNTLPNTTAVVCDPSPSDFSSLVCSGGDLNRLLRGAAFQTKDRLTAKRKQDSLVAITYAAQLGTENIKVLDAALTAVYHAERANRSVRVVAGGLPHWALGGYLVRSRSEAQLRELVAEAVFQNKGVGNTLRDTLLDLAPDAQWVSSLYSAALLRQAAAAAAAAGAAEDTTPSPRRGSRRKRQVGAAVAAPPAEDAPPPPAVAVPLPAEQLDSFTDAWGVLQALEQTHGHSHQWLDWDTLQSLAAPSGAGVLLASVPTPGASEPPLTPLDDDAFVTGAALLRLQSRDAPAVPDAPPLPVSVQTVASPPGASGSSPVAEADTPLDWAGGTQPAFDDDTLQQRHSLRKVISGLGMEHEEGEPHTPPKPSVGGVQWGSYHDRHSKSQAQANEDELWFMPEHVESPTGTHLRSLYSAQLTPHTGKDQIQAQRTAERRAQQLLRRMRFMLSQQRRADAERMQLAFDAAATVALPLLPPSHEVRLQHLRSRALQQEAFSTTSDSSDGSVSPLAVLPGSPLAAYIPPAMTPEYAADYSLNDIVPNFAQKWNSRREQQITALQAHADRLASEEYTDSDDSAGGVWQTPPPTGQHTAPEHTLARAPPRKRPTQDAAPPLASADSLGAVLMDGGRRALPLLPREAWGTPGALIQQLCLFAHTDSQVQHTFLRPCVPLGAVPVPGVQGGRLVALPMCAGSALLAKDAGDAAARQRKLGILNALFDSPPERSSHAYAPVGAADLWGWWMREHNTWPRYWPDLPAGGYSPAAAEAYMHGLTSQRNALAFDAGRGGVRPSFDGRSQEQRDEDTAARRFDVTQYDWDI